VRRRVVGHRYGVTAMAAFAFAMLSLVVPLVAL
jgi:hypothetical protein